jgi:hypothetical protein
MKRKIFIILLFVNPILYFFGLRFMQMIFSTDRTESLKSEIIIAMIIGYTISFALWYLDRKSRKEKESQAKDSHIK